MNEQEIIIVVGYRTKLIDYERGKYKNEIEIIKVEPEEPIITLKRRLEDKDSTFYKFEIIPENKISELRT